MRRAVRHRPRLAAILGQGRFWALAILYVPAIRITYGRYKIVDGFCTVLNALPESQHRHLQLYLVHSTFSRLNNKTFFLTSRVPVDRSGCTKHFPLVSGWIVRMIDCVGARAGAGRVASRLSR